MKINESIEKKVLVFFDEMILYFEFTRNRILQEHFLFQNLSLKFEKFILLFKKRNKFSKLKILRTFFIGCEIFFGFFFIFEF